MLMHFRIAVVWLATLVFVAIVARVSAQPIAPTDQGTCVLRSGGLGKPQNYGPCEPFIAIAPTIIDRIPGDRFGRFGINSNPVALALLSDGSPVVDAGEGLFHLIQGRIEVVLPPAGVGCGDFLPLIGAFDREAFIKDEGAGTVKAIRLNGSVAFEWSRKFGNRDASPSKFIAADRYGTLWFEWEANGRTVFYAYDPRTRVITTLDRTFGFAFGSPNGRVYANANQGLFELTSRPHVSARLIHARIPAPPMAPSQLGVDWPYGPTLPIQAVGADGSFWATTISQVIHIHPDGTTHVIRLAPPANSWTMLPSPILITMAPDGSIWMSHRPVHINTDDRVQVITLPSNESWKESLSPSEDGSLWVLAYNEGTGGRDVVHFALSASTKIASSETSWTMTPAATPPPCH
jgi:hypothetical protein